MSPVLNSRKPLVDVNQSGVDTGRNIAIQAAMGANNAPKKWTQETGDGTSTGMT